MVGKKKSKNIPETVTGSESLKLVSTEVLRGALLLDARKAVQHSEVQAHYLLHAGEHHARAVKKLNTCKQDLERHVAKMSDLIRAAAESKRSKITDKAVNAKVDLDPHVIALQDRILQLELKELRLKYLVEAYRHRKDAIFGLRLMRQDEMKSYN